MSRSTIRSARPLVRHAALLVAATTLLAGCSAGQVATTARKAPSVPGTNTQVGDIAIRNALVSFPEKEEGGYKAGDEVPIELGIGNLGGETDTLVRVTSESAERVELRAGAEAPAPTTATPTPDRCRVDNPPATPTGAATPSATPPASPTASPSPTTAAPPSLAAVKVEIPPGCLVRLDQTGQQLVLVGFKPQDGEKTLSVGGEVAVTFEFERAGSATVTLVVGPPHTPLPRESPESEGGEGEQ